MRKDLINRWEMAGLVPVLARVHWKPILQRLTGVWYIAFILLTIGGPIYAPVTFSVYFVFLHIVFAVNNVRLAWVTRRALIESIKHSCTVFPIYDNVQHVIVLPNYKESMETLFDTLDVLASHSCALRQYKIVLAMEMGEKECHLKANALIRKYEDAFYDITYTVHPQNLPGEVRGKASNLSWAVREMVRLSNGPCPNDILTVMDADSCLAEDYFKALAHHFMSTPAHLRHMTHFIPPFVFDRNLDQVPPIVRVADMLWSAGAMSTLYQSSYAKLPCSAYSLPIELAHAVDYWETDDMAVGEDVHMYLKCLFATEGRLRSITIFSPTSQCNVQGTSMWNSFVLRYNQGIRLMWGTLEVGYIFRRSLFGVLAPGYDAPHGKLVNVPLVYPKPLLESDSFANESGNTMGLDEMRATASNIPVPNASTHNGLNMGLILALLYILSEASILLGQLVAAVVLVAVFIPVPGSLPIAPYMYYLLSPHSVHPYVALAVWACGWARAVFTIPIGLTLYYYENWQQWVGKDRWRLSDEEQVCPGTGLKVQPLGKRAALVSERTNWAWFDWVNIPLCGIFYLTMSQIQAQLYHLISVRLEYTVSLKPTVSNAPSVRSVDDTRPGTAFSIRSSVAFSDTESVVSNDYTMVDFEVDDHPDKRDDKLSAVPSPLRSKKHQSLKVESANGRIDSAYFESEDPSKRQSRSPSVEFKRSRMSIKPE